MSSKDKVMGSFIAAAIGDAMGGPVECQHAARIKKVYGTVDSLLPYEYPKGLMRPHSGYTRHTQPGSVTDDTYIRAEITRFYLGSVNPRTPRMLAEWLFEYADFDKWPHPAVAGLLRVVRDGLSPEEAGNTNEQGGFVGWWTPIGVANAGRPEDAAVEAARLSRIFKAPLERDLVGAVQAGVAAAFADDATVDSVVGAMRSVCGPLASRLIQRAVDIARGARDFDDLVKTLYANCLLDEAPTAADAELPTFLTPIDFTDHIYTSVLLAEQVPLAVAAFVFADGDPVKSIPTAVMIGRDCDTTATTVGSWVGAMHGESSLPKEWVDTVCRVNLNEVDLRGLAEGLFHLDN